MSPDEVEATETGAATGYGDEAAASEKVVNVDQVVSTQDITEDLPVITTAEAEGRVSAAVILAIIFLSRGLTIAPSRPLVMAITIKVWFKNGRTGNPYEMLDRPQAV